MTPACGVCGHGLIGEGGYFYCATCKQQRRPAHGVTGAATSAPQAHISGMLLTEWVEIVERRLLDLESEVRELQK
jgi:ABC-type phosphate/phosphonate transport system permease subunit